MKQLSQLVDLRVTIFQLLNIAVHQQRSLSYYRGLATRVAGAVLGMCGLAGLGLGMAVIVTSPS